MAKLITSSCNFRSFEVYEFLDQLKDFKFISLKDESKTKKALLIQRHSGERCFVYITKKDFCFIDDILDMFD